MGVVPPRGEFDDSPGEKTKSQTDAIEDALRKLKLIAFTEAGPLSFLLPDQGSVTIGRGEQSEVRIQASSISRTHAALHVSKREDGEHVFTVEDLGSANGTRVQGKTLEKLERREVAAGEVFDAGAIMMMVRGGARAIDARPRRLWTHGAFEEKLEAECARGAASKIVFALFRVRAERVDADAVESTLAGMMRSFDIIARYAPGEWEILVLDAMPQAANELRGRVAAGLDALGASNLSIGIACYPEDGRSAEDLGAKAAALEGPGSIAGSIVVVEESPMSGLFRLVDRVAASDITVLILGETGVGKEVMAEAIHARSPRAKQHFLRLNCAALAPNLLESELFGHDKGAFTGAEEAKPGLLESADGGTVFLDEIGELPNPIQVKLLRVLEEKKVLRVGGRKPIDIDVRFLAATNRDLESDVAKGTFRIDLFYRLNGVTLSIPPLRERRMEIAPLARAFATHAKQNVAIDPAAIEILEAYYWPGNIRELRNVIERALLLAESDVIRREHLPLEKLCAQTLKPTPPPPTRMLSLQSEDERERIMEALRVCVGNQTAAAAMLGISRSTLVARLNAYQIPRPRKR